MGKVILTADDFGACKFIDDGISRAIAGGHINTVSTFVTHERSQESIRKLIQWRNETKNDAGYRFNIGLHFSMTSGYSLQHQESSLTTPLTDGKYFFKSEKKYPFNDILQADLQNELIAQLKQLDEWLEESPIDHVTVHHGIPYLDEGLFSTFISTIANYKGLPGSTKYDTRKIPIRSPRSWFKGTALPNCCYHPENGKIILLPGLGVEGFGLGYWKKIGQTTKRRLAAKKTDSDAFGLPSADYLVDVIYDQACENGINCLLRALSKNDITVEFMLHLGFQEGAEEFEGPEFILNTSAAHGIDHSYFERRMKEELITIEEMNLSNLIRQQNIPIVFYSDL